MNEFKMESKTDSLNNALAAPSIETGALVVANAYLEGKSISDIAIQFNISEEQVQEALSGKVCQKYIDTQIANIGNLHKVHLAEVCSRLFAEAVENGTRKDPLDWAKFIKENFHDGMKEKTPTNQTNIQINEGVKILESIKNEMKEIRSGDE